MVGTLREDIIGVEVPGGALVWTSHRFAPMALSIPYEQRWQLAAELGPDRGRQASSTGALLWPQARDLSELAHCLFMGGAWTDSPGGSAPLALTVGTELSELTLGGTIPVLSGDVPLLHRTLVDVGDRPVQRGCIRSLWTAAHNGEELWLTTPAIGVASRAHFEAAGYRVTPFASIQLLTGTPPGISHVGPVRCLIEEEWLPRDLDYSPLLFLHLFALALWGAADPSVENRRTVLRSAYGLLTRGPSVSVCPRDDHATVTEILNSLATQRQGG